MASAPRIVSRRDWGAATTVPGGRGVPLNQRRFFVVHWPVMSNRDERQWCRDIERIHRGQGYAAAPGYNFIVGQSGTIYEGAGRDNRGIHCPNRNTDGFGVCMLQPSTPGGAPTAAVSQAARNGCRALYDWLNSATGRTLTRTWHGAHFATACPGPDLRGWVQAGMPSTGGGGTPTPPPEPTTEEDLVTAAIAANGAFHVFALRDGWIWYTWQRKGENAWNGGKSGQGPAGMIRFAPAQDVVSINAAAAENGVLHLFARRRDGSLVYTWQPRNSSGWHGGKAGQSVAGLVAFAPR